jgi:hypothetical protein
MGNKFRSQIEQVSFATAGSSPKDPTGTKICMGENIPITNQTSSFATAGSSTSDSARTKYRTLLN